MTPRKGKDVPLPSPTITRIKWVMGMPYFVQGTSQGWWLGMAREIRMYDGRQGFVQYCPSCPCEGIAHTHGTERTIELTPAVKGVVADSKA